MAPVDNSLDNHLAAAATYAIREGNVAVAVLEQLLQQYRFLAMTRVDGRRTLLHVATD